MKYRFWFLAFALIAGRLYAQPHMLFPRFPVPLCYKCFGDSGVAALYSGSALMSGDFGAAPHAQAMVRYSSDAGKSWYRSHPVPYTFSRTSYPNSVVFLDSLTIIGQAIQQVDAPTVIWGKLVRSSDGGRSWTEVLATSALGELSFPTNKRGTYCDGDSVFWSTEDGGQSWRPNIVPRINPDEPNSISEVLPLSPDRWLILTSSHETFTGRIQYRFRASAHRIEDSPTRFLSSNQSSFWVADVLKLSQSQDSVLITTVVTIQDRRYPELDDVRLWVQASTDCGTSWTTQTFSGRSSAAFFRNQLWKNRRVEPTWFNDSIGLLPFDAIHRTTNAGRTWSSISVQGAFLASCSPTGFGVVKGIIPFGKDATDQDSVRSVTYVTHDFGATWESTVEIQGSYYHSEKGEIVQDSERHRIVIRNGNTAIVSSNEEEKWIEATITLEPRAGAYPITDASHPLFILGEYGRIHLGCYGHSDDGGLTWVRPTVAPLDLHSAAQGVRGRGGHLVQAQERDGSLIWTVSSNQGETWEVQDSLRVPGMRATVVDRLVIHGRDSTIQCLVTSRDTCKEWYLVKSDWPYKNWMTRRVSSPPSVFGPTLDSFWVVKSVSLNGKAIIILHRLRDSLVVSSDFGESWSAMPISRSPSDGIVQNKGRIISLLALNSGAFLYGDPTALRISRDGGRTWPLLSTQILEYPQVLRQDADNDVWMMSLSVSNYFADHVYFHIPADYLLSSSNEDMVPPPSFTLPPAWPNPASSQGAVHLPYELSSPSEVTIVIRDILGRAVARLEQGRRDVGRHEALWQPRGLGPGVYLTQVSAGSGRVAMGKVVMR